MQAPNAPLPAYTISELDPLQTPVTQLAGALLEFEIEISPGSYKNVRGTTEELAQYLATLGTPGATAAPGFSYAFRPNGDIVPSPALADYLDAGGEFYWMSPNASGQRQLVSAGTSPMNTPPQNSTALISMAAGLPKP